MILKFKKRPICRFLRPEFISEIHMFLEYGKCGDSCLIVTKNKEVYVISNNIDDVSTFIPEKIDILCGKDIKTAFSLKMSVLILTKDGELYVYRELKSGAGFIKKCDSLYIPLEDNETIKSIAYGNKYITLLIEDKIQVVEHDLITNASKRLKIQYNQKEDATLFLKKFVSISCSFTHYMAVTHTGSVYGWSDNSHGHTNSLKPLLIRSLDGILIVKVVCGSRHTLALSYEGIVYSWGDNSWGQLGIIDDSQYSATPTQIPILKDVLDIASDGYINVAMTEQSEIFIWGGYPEGCTIGVPTLIFIDDIYEVFTLCQESITNMYVPHVIDIVPEEEEDDTDDEETNILYDMWTAFDNKEIGRKVTPGDSCNLLFVFDIVNSVFSFCNFNYQAKGCGKENAVIPILSFIDACFLYSVLKVDDFSYEAYRGFLKFLYTGKIDPFAEDIIEMLRLANYLSQSDFRTCCQRDIRHIISVDNVATLYDEAVQCNDMELKKCCLDFAVKQMTRIVLSKSFAELSKETLLNFIIEVNKLEAPL